MHTYSTNNDIMLLIRAQITLTCNY